MDIGTAKPTAAERAEVPHHLLDLLDPWEDGTVAWFQHEARAAIADIEARGHRALLVGGTALYVQAVVDDLDIPGQYPEVRADLEADPDTRALHAQLAELDPLAAGRMEPTNRRRIVRALEVTLGSGRPFSSYGPGLDAHPPTALHARRAPARRATTCARGSPRATTQQMDAGFLDEVRRLRADPRGISRTAAPGPRLQGAARPPRRRRSPSTRRSTSPSAAPAASPAASGPGSAAIPASPGSTPTPGRPTGTSSWTRLRGGRRLDDRMRLTKHHGLGNDFLVLLDLDGTRPVSPEEAAALCDRRTGLGADGLLRATAGTDGADVTMELLNADGSPRRDERQRHPLPRPGGVPGRAGRRRPCSPSPPTPGCAPSRVVSRSDAAHPPHERRHGPGQGRRRRARVGGGRRARGHPRRRRQPAPRAALGRRRAARTRRARSPSAPASTAPPRAAPTSRSCCPSATRRRARHGRVRARRRAHPGLRHRRLRRGRRRPRVGALRAHRHRPHARRPGGDRPRRPRACSPATSPPSPSSTRRGRRRRSTACR